MGVCCTLGISPNNCTRTCTTTLSSATTALNFTVSVSGPLSSWLLCLHTLPQLRGELTATPAEPLHQPSRRKAPATYRAVHECTHGCGSDLRGKGTVLSYRPWQQKKKKAENVKEGFIRAGTHQPPMETWP